MLRNRLIGPRRNDQLTGTQHGLAIEESLWDLSVWSVCRSWTLMVCTPGWTGTTYAQTIRGRVQPQRDRQQIFVSCERAITAIIIAVGRKSQRRYPRTVILLRALLTEVRGISPGKPSPNRVAGELRPGDVTTFAVIFSPALQGATCGTAIGNAGSFQIWSQGYQPGTRNERPRANRCEPITQCR
jgi:hypothetical protein